MRPASRSWATVGVLVLAVTVALASVTVVLRHRHSESSDPLSPILASAPVGETKSMLFLGDSYTIGPTSLPDLGYACLTASSFGWNCNLGAQAGTGYISGGPDHRVYPVMGTLGMDSTSLFERVPRMRALYDADVVVLDAGRNDLSYGQENLDNLFVYTLERVQEAWPNAQIVVIPPWFIKSVDLYFEGDGADLSVAASLEKRLRSDPAFDQVLYINPSTLNWFSGEDVTSLMDKDNIHPNKLGHQVIARKLAAALTEEGIGTDE